MIILKGTTTSGVEYVIDDRYMAPRGSDVERSVMDEQRLAAYDILKKYAERHEEQSA